ncbi:MAG: DMT family transporter [DPANN group archaeon]|nr:DMT family transporter [DPANN group archaeon]
MFLASFLNALRMFLYFVGFTYASVSNAVIMLYTWPIFARFSVFFLKEKIECMNIFLLFVSFIGIVIVYMGNGFSFLSKDFIGMSAMLLSACFYSMTIIIFKSESKKYSQFEIIFYQNLVGSFVFLPFLFRGWSSLSFFKVDIVSVHAVLVGVIGFGLFFSALKNIKVSTA